MTSTVAPRSGPRATRDLRAGFVLSVVVHIGLAALAGWWAVQADVPRPPVYRVELIGAPPGLRQAGVVSPVPPQQPVESPSVAPAGAERLPEEKATPAPRDKKVPKPTRTPKATPSPVRSKEAGAKASPAPKVTAPAKAGSGREGGAGADVRTIRTEGIAFPYQGYLNNIMRQITLAYTPRRVAATLRAEVKFLIRRDGSVAGIEVVRSSGDRLFDLEAQSTVESVGAARSFGPLPSGWQDDVLVVYFTFDYALRP